MLLLLALIRARMIAMIAIDLIIEIIEIIAINVQMGRYRSPMRPISN
jgi:hypothetical protein